MKEIPTTRGKFVLVDDDDYLVLSRQKWCSDEYGYAKRRKDKYGRESWMHRLIMNAPAHLEVDHVDGNRLNNQKYNLRLCTHAQNSRNRRKNISHKSSAFKGVSWNPIGEKWCARITVSGRTIHLGYFVEEEDAAKAYIAAAREYHGEFVRESSIEVST